MKASKTLGAAGSFRAATLSLSLACAACGPRLPATGASVGGARQELVVLPDDGADLALEDWARASSTLRLEAYMLTDERATEALRAAAARGVRVQVVLEPTPYGAADANQAAFDLLRESGIETRWARRHSGFVHAKTWVVDDALVDVGTANLTRSGLVRNRELILRTRDAATAEALGHLLEDDRAGLGDDAIAADLDLGAGPPSAPLAVSPFQTRATMTSLIAAARTRLVLATELFDDPALAEAIATRARAGVAVTLLLSAGDAIPESQATSLTNAGVDVRVLGAPYLHAKAVLADDARYLVGSPNLTRASLDVNREVALTGNDSAVAARLAQVFAADARVATTRAR